MLGAMDNRDVSRFSANAIAFTLDAELPLLWCPFGQEEKQMKYGLAWLLGVPTFLIVIWFLFNHM